MQQYLKKKTLQKLTWKMHLILIEKRKEYDKTKKKKKKKYNMSAESKIKELNIILPKAARSSWILFGYKNYR